MLKHIVLFKLKEEYSKTVEDKDVYSRKVAAQLETLPHNIEEIIFFEVGANQSNSVNAFDIILVSEFETEADLKIYQKHPVHVKCVEEIHKYVNQIAVGDYENLVASIYKMD